jgi:hypothetical protein
VELLKEEDRNRGFRAVLTSSCGLAGVRLVWFFLGTHGTIYRFGSLVYRSMPIATVLGRTVRTHKKSRGGGMVVIA